MKTLSLFGGLLLLAGFANANDAKMYEVTITNVTRGQSFTPQLVASSTTATR